MLSLTGKTGNGGGFILNLLIGGTIVTRNGKTGLVRVLVAAKLKYLKILVPRLPHNTSNVNIENSGKSKQLHYVYDQLFHFIVLILICF